jgi:hypothetical protein
MDVRVPSVWGRRTCVLEGFQRDFDGWETGGAGEDGELPDPHNMYITSSSHVLAYTPTICFSCSGV